MLWHAHAAAEWGVGTAAVLTVAMPLEEEEMPQLQWPQKRSADSREIPKQDISMAGEGSQQVSILTAPQATALRRHHTGLTWLRRRAAAQAQGHHLSAPLLAEQHTGQTTAQSSYATRSPAKPFHNHSKTSLSPPFLVMITTGTEVVVGAGVATTTGTKMSCFFCTTGTSTGTGTSTF